MMSTARLREIYKQEQNHRKFACVRNDMVKTQLDQYEGFIDKEKQESVQKNQKSIVYTRKHVVRRRVLESCMKHQRDEVKRSSDTTLYGQYNGVAVEEIAGQVDGVMEENHPRNRRRRKIEELFSRGYRKGALLDSRTVKNKVEKYFEKPLVEVHMESKQTPEVKEPEVSKSVLPFPTDRSFYTGDREPNKNDSSIRDDEEPKQEERLFIRKRVNKRIEEDFPDDLSLHSDGTSHKKVAPRKIVRPLTLPPIKIGTDNSTPSGKPVTDSITDIIARMNHANDRREREMKVKKERRQRRILAEKVHGIGQGQGQSEMVEPEVQQINQTVPTVKPAGRLNLTAPVFSKSNRPMGRGLVHQSDGITVSRDVNNRGRETREDGGGLERRLILPPLKVKRSSLASLEKK